ncbi:phasin [Flexibacterium corallicola]|uniref:phasin n=1 Tax=Flexibacterium corallicola TaxID=3037259 RepID=UPI00286EB576|nr:phasin [Pseudovibrio sp. M1P-2-3]
MAVTETATKTAPKGRTAKAAATPKSTPKADTEMFAMNTMEVPAFLREATEKSVEQAKDAYTKMKSASEEATDLLEEAFETTREGVLELNLKAVDAAKTNSDAVFSYMKDMFGTKTLSEAIELQSSFARTQYEAVTEQAKDMQELATKLATSLSEPAKNAIEKAAKDFKVA